MASFLRNALGVSAEMLKPDEPDPRPWIGDDPPFAGNTRLYCFPHAWADDAVTSIMTTISPTGTP